MYRGRSPLLPWKRLLATQTLPRGRVPLLPQQVLFQAETFRTGPPPLATSRRFFCVHGSRVEPDRLRGKADGLSNRGACLEGGSYSAEDSRGERRDGTTDGAVDRRVGGGGLGRGTKGDASATHATARVPANVALRQKQPGEEDEKRNRERSPEKPNHPPKSPNAVAMEEFAALERKLAASAAPASAAPAAPVHPLIAVTVKAKAKKTAEQVAMEEFAALERKLGGAERVETGSPREARSVSLARPKVRFIPVGSMQLHTPAFLSVCAHDDRDGVMSHPAFGSRRVHTGSNPRIGVFLGSPIAS